MRLPAWHVVCVDHGPWRYAPKTSGGMAGPRCFADASKEAEWKTCITELATCPNVHMKVGGLQMGAVIIQRA